MPSKHRVIIFSPNRYSTYTICVAELLRRAGVEVSAIIVRRLLNPKRLASEWVFGGARLLKKIWHKLVLRGHLQGKKNYMTLRDFMRDGNIKKKKVEDFQNEGIPCFYCDDFNEPKVLEILEKKRPEIIFFTGGGLLREGVLQRAGDGVLNCHMGILPEYRGMDVVEWALVEGREDKVGLTVHFMDKGVDTGDILVRRLIKPKSGDTLDDLRGRFEVPMCQELVGAGVSWLAKNLLREPQTDAPERQYFKMHPRFTALARRELPQ